MAGEVGGHTYRQHVHERGHRRPPKRMEKRPRESPHGRRPRGERRTCWSRPSTARTSPASDQGRGKPVGPSRGGRRGRFRRRSSGVGAWQRPAVEQGSSAPRAASSAAFSPCRADDSAQRRVERYPSPTVWHEGDPYPAQSTEFPYSAPMASSPSTRSRTSSSRARSPLATTHARLTLSTRDSALR